MIPVKYFYEIVHRRRTHLSFEDKDYDLAMLELIESLRLAVSEGKRSYEEIIPSDYDDKFQKEMKLAGYFLEKDPRPEYRKGDNRKLTRWKISWKYEPEKWNLDIN